MSGRIAPEFIGDQFPGRRTLSLQQLAKEPRGSLFILSLRHQNVENIAVLIDGAPQIPLLSLDFDEDFIDMPDVPPIDLVSFGAFERIPVRTSDTRNGWLRAKQ